MKAAGDAESSGPDAAGPRQIWDAAGSPPRDRSSPRDAATALVLAAALACSVAFFLTRAFSPFRWFYDENAALFGYIGSNYLRHGLAATRGGMQHWTSLRGPVASPEFYSTHPPILGWLCGLFQWLFGIHPIAVRLVPAVAQLGSLVPLYAIGRRLFGRRAAAWGTLAYALLPMTAYFGFMVNFEPVTNLFVLLAIWAYVSIRDDGWSAARGAALGLALLAGMWTDWPAYFAAGAIGLDWLVTGRGRARWLALLPWSVAIVSFSLFLAFIYGLGGLGFGGVGSLWNAFVNRTGLAPDEHYAAADVVSYVIEENVRLYGLGLALLGLGVAVLRSWRAVRPLAIVWVTGTLNVLLFSFGAASHEYWTFYFAAPVGIAAMALFARYAAGPARRSLTAVATAVVLLLGGQSAWVIRDYYTPDYWEWADCYIAYGRIIGARAKPDEVILMAFEWGDGATTGYYAQRPVVRVDSTDELDQARRHPDFRGGYLVRNWMLEGEQEAAWLDRLPRVGELRAFDTDVEILYVPPAAGDAPTTGRPEGMSASPAAARSAPDREPTTPGGRFTRPLAADTPPRPPLGKGGERGVQPGDDAGGEFGARSQLSNTGGRTAWPLCARPNVVLVLFESTGARYCDLYGASYPTTPHLRRLAEHAATFDRFYAQGAVSTRALLSLFCGVYPRPDAEMEPIACPTLDLPSLPELFRAAGYATAFLHPTELDFQSNAAFLAARGFEHLIGVDELRRRHAIVTVPDYDDWFDVVDDRALAPEALGVIDRCGGRPFFVVLATYMPHWPYYPTTDPVDFGTGDKAQHGSFDSYLNTLRNQDRMVGEVVRGLEERGLLGTTILVVTADHGESFGQHGSWVHGDDLYDEVLHVPLVIANPLLFPEPVRVAGIGQHIDLAPTLAELVGLAVPESWQGASLFATDRPATSYHVLTPEEGGLVLALHEGRFKYIYGPSHRIEELYNVEADPAETTNLAVRPEYAESVERLRARVLAWAEFQQAYVQRSLDRSRMH